MAIRLEPGQSSELVENNVISQMQGSLDTAIFIDGDEAVRLYNFDKRMRLSLGDLELYRSEPGDSVRIKVENLSTAGDSSASALFYTHATSGSAYAGHTLRVGSHYFTVGLNTSGNLLFNNGNGIATTNVLTLYNSNDVGILNGSLLTAQPVSDEPTHILRNDGSAEDIYMLVGTTDVLTIPVDAPRTSLYFKADTANIYVKQDDGSTTNWLPVGAGGGEGEAGLEQMLNENDMEEIAYTSFTPFDPVNHPSLVNESASQNSEDNVATSQRDFTEKGEIHTYEGRVLPQNAWAASGGDWVEALTGGAGAAVASGILTITVPGAADTGYYTKGHRAEIDNTADVELEWRMRVTSSTLDATGDLNCRITGNKMFRLQYIDVAGTKKIRIDDNAGSAVNDIDGNAAELNLNWDQWHTYRLQKISQDRVQVFVDGILQFTVPYANLPTTGSSVQIIFGHTSTGTTSTSEWDFVNYRAYMSTMQTKVISRRGTWAWEGTVAPEASNEPIQDDPSDYYLEDLFQQWSKNGGDTVTFPNGQTTPDAFGRFSAAGVMINYGIVTTRFAQGHVAIETRFRPISVNVGTDMSVVRILGARKSAYVSLWNNGGNLSLRLTNSGSSIASSPTVPITLGEWYTIRLERDRYNSFKWYLNGVLQDEQDYDIFTDAGTDTASILFGHGGSVTAVLDAQYIRVAHSNDTPYMARSPISEVVGFAVHNDDEASYIISSDGGRHWTEPVYIGSDKYGEEIQGLGDDDRIGGDLVVRYRQANQYVDTSSLDKFAVLYNKIDNADEEPTGGRYSFGPVVGGDLNADGSLDLDHNLNAAVNSIELEVYAGAARIHPDIDYDEITPQTIKILSGVVGATYHIYKKPAGQIAREVGLDGRTVLSIGDGVNSVGDFIGNTEQVFIDAINAAILAGGAVERKIFVGAGVFNFAATVNLNIAGIEIEGSGWNTEIIGPGKASGIDAFTLSAAEIGLSKMRIRNFQDGIQLSSGADRCQVDCRVTANDEGIVIDSGADENIINGFVHDNDTNGVVDNGNDNIIAALVIRNP